MSSNIYILPGDGNNAQNGPYSTLGRYATMPDYAANFGNITMQQGAGSGTAFVSYLTDNSVRYDFMGAPFGSVIIAARSNHSGGVNVGFCDGSVKFVKNSVSPPTYQALSSTRGGEIVSSDSY